MTTQEFTIMLRCTDANQAICSGECFLFTDVRACGRCGHDCTALASPGAPRMPICSAGKCTRVYVISSVRQSCQTVCSGASLACHEWTDINLKHDAYYSVCSTDPNCATVPVATLTCSGQSFTSNFVRMTCNCQEP